VMGEENIRGCRAKIMDMDTLVILMQAAPLCLGRLRERIDALLRAHSTPRAHARPRVHELLRDLVLAEVGDDEGAEHDDADEHGDHHEAHSPPHAQPAARDRVVGPLHYAHAHHRRGDHWLWRLGLGEGNDDLKVTVGAPACVVCLELATEPGGDAVVVEGVVARQCRDNLPVQHVLQTHHALLNPPSMLARAQRVRRSIKQFHRVVQASFRKHFANVPEDLPFQRRGSPAFVWVCCCIRSYLRTLLKRGILSCPRAGFQRTANIERKLG